MLVAAQMVASMPSTSKVGWLNGLLTRATTLGAAVLEPGDLRDDDVVLVVAGHGHDQVGAADAGLLEHPDLGAVAEHEVVAELLEQQVVARLALLDRRSPRGPGAAGCARC